MSDTHPFTQPATTEHNAEAITPCLLVCEHASNYIPPAYKNLGLANETLTEHICWDPGAYELTKSLSQRLDCSAVASNYSRLLIDCNRPIDIAASIAVVSELHRIPGNERVDEAERDLRIKHIYTPFHAAVLAQVQRLKAQHDVFPVVGIHSFTPQFHGQSRPWKFSLMWKETSPFVQELIEYLEAHEIADVIGFNEPYSAKTIRAHTTEYYTDRFNLPAIIFEVRQDLLITQDQVAYWTDFISAALRHAFKVID